MSGSPQYSIIRYIIGDRIIYSTVVSLFQCNFWPRTGVLDDEKIQLGVSHMALAHLLMVMVGSTWQHLPKAFRFFLQFFFLFGISFACLNVKAELGTRMGSVHTLQFGEKP